MHPILCLIESGQFRPCLHENFKKFEMISIPTGSWIDRVTELSTLSMGQIIDCI